MNLNNAQSIAEAASLESPARTTVNLLRAQAIALSRIQVTTRSVLGRVSMKLNGSAGLGPMLPIPCAYHFWRTSVTRFRECHVCTVEHLTHEGLVKTGIARSYLLHTTPSGTAFHK